MDFDLSDEEQAISDLARQILGDKSTHERLKQLKADGDRVDTEAWAAAIIDYIEANADELAADPAMIGMSLSVLSPSSP